MTHDQLLARIKEDFFFTQGLGTVLHMNSCSSSPCHCSAIDVTHLNLKNAMLAVVKLHNNYHGMCMECELTDYPCPTIESIEKELKEWDAYSS